MNNPVDQIKQMTRNLHKAKSGVRYVNILRPKRDWFLGLAVGFCILVGVSVWNGYMYLENRDRESTDVEISVANPRYQAVVVDQALEIFTTKATEFAAINANNASVSVFETEATQDIATTSSSSLSSTEEVILLEEGDETTEPSSEQSQAESAATEPQDSQLETDPASTSESPDSSPESVPESETPQLMQ